MPLMRLSRAEKEAKLKEKKDKEEKAKRGFFSFGASKKVTADEEEDFEDYEEVGARHTKRGIPHMTILSLTHILMQ